MQLGGGGAGMALPVSSLTVHWMTRVVEVGMGNYQEFSFGVFISLKFLKGLRIDDY